MLGSFTIFSMIDLFNFLILFLDLVDFFDLNLFDFNLLIDLCDFNLLIDLCDFLINDFFLHFLFFFVVRLIFIYYLTI